MASMGSKRLLTSTSCTPLSPHKWVDVSSALRLHFFHANAHLRFSPPHNMATLTSAQLLRIAAQSKPGHRLEVTVYDSGRAVV